MLLTSSLEPGGPRSTHSYIILHHENQRRLIKLPETYYDLKKEVESAYQIDPERFHIETKELNICAGEKVKIPEEVWSDLAKLLGNVYVVPGSGEVLRSERTLEDEKSLKSEKPLRGEEPLITHPEYIPDPEVVSFPTPVQLDPTMITLERPLVKDEIIMLYLGELKSKVDSAHSKQLIVRVLDDKQNTTLTIGICPHIGVVTLASTTNERSTTVPLEEVLSSVTYHHIFIYKQNFRFLVLFDSQLLGAVEALEHPPLTHVACGLLSPFKGPISAVSYPGFAHLHDNCGCADYPFTLPSDKATLYQKVLACEPRVPEMLATVRNEITFFKYSSNGTKWHSQQIPFNKWTFYRNEPHPLSVLVIRYKLTEEAPKSKRLDVRFDSIKSSYNSYMLHIEINASYLVEFWEPNKIGELVKSHQVRLEHSMHAAGDHSVALVNHGGRFHVLFDFKQSTIIPTNTFIIQKPGKMSISIVDNCIVEADVYQFS